MHKEGIAIVGVACRFPGRVNSADDLWQLLVEGREAVSEVPADRWNVERYYDPQPGLPGKSMAKRGGFIEGLEQFDPQFFGISPREAPYVDPQQRLLLETAWEAIEDAGMVLDFERGTDLAVYVGVSHNDYQAIQGTAWDHAHISAHSPTGSAHSIAANRISYCLNLRGPSLAVDTACSSALTAVHLACEHLWSGRGPAALAGGVTVMITPGGFIGFSQAAMLSPEGRCAAFDASASGFVRGEGAGMVLLKPLSKALADGDPIHGVIVSTACNQDGHTNGISLPSPEAQAALVREACQVAGIDPATVAFVEAHGTGTAVGDPIEAHALADALCQTRATPLPIGSVKTNLGHLETAAGVAGLVKAMLVLRHKQIPPSLHFTTPNPHIDFDGLKLRVPTALEPLPPAPGNAPRLAGVNSFGFGGANAHTILAEPPAPEVRTLTLEEADRPWPLVVSARSEKALQDTAARLATWIDDHMRSNGQAPLLPDLTYTLGARRNHHPHRLTLVARHSDEAIEELRAFGANDGSGGEKIRTSFTPRPEHAPRVGFVFSGQGPQWWGMGRELMAREPVFRAALERCAAALAPHARFDLLEELTRDEATSRMASTEVAQPAIFAFQVALAELWKSWGVQPAAIVGHSVGEIAASCVAGVLPLEEAARVIALRSRFMEGCARGEGTMLAVALSEEEARAVIARHDRTVGIAAFNGPRSLTLSGPRVSLEAIAAELEPQNVFARFVRVDHPFHHLLMTPAASELEESLSDLAPQPEQVPFFSTVTGGRCAGAECGAAHWARGVREAVLFAPAVAAMADTGIDVWLELSAHPALALAIQECLGARGYKAPVVSSARREHEHENVLEAALSLHRAAVAIDFAALAPTRNILPLPAYAWDRARWWSESPDWRDGRLNPGGRGLLDVRLPRATPTWHTRLDARHMAFLKDHRVESHTIFPGAGFIEMALEAGVQLFEGRPFVIEDFEVRRPLLIPEDASSVLLELDFDPETHLLTIQSRQGSAWSTHVVGSLRGERAESGFAHTEWPAPENVAPLDVEDFYGHMHQLGLRYGPEFRGVRALAARDGRSAGDVALGEAARERHEHYALHPVLMDAALHVFSAGAKTLEGRNSRMKLPVRFARIEFLRSPGASARVQARIRTSNDELVEGDISLWDAEGRPCARVQGFRAISLAAARRAGSSGGLRDLVYHVDWERTSADATPLPPVPLDALRLVAAEAMESVVGVRGRECLRGTLIAQDELAAAQLAAGLRAMGANGAFSAGTLGVAESLRPAFARLTLGLAERHLIAADGDGWTTTPEFVKAADGATDVLRAFIHEHPGHLAEAQLCANVAADLGPILRGELDAVQSLFGGGSADLLDHFYGEGLFSSHWMAAIGAAVKASAAALPHGCGLRILEVGAGTGGLSANVLPLLERGRHTYVFTDVSPSFFQAAGQKLAGFPEVEFKVLDLEKPAPAQDFAPESFDLIIGANVIHAVRDVPAALANLHDLLAPGGTFAFAEVATPHLWTDLVFGLTSGWWRFHDSLRTEHPLLQRDQWEAALRAAGFAEATSLPGIPGLRGEGQVAILARKATRDVPAPTPVLPSAASWLVVSSGSTLADDLVAQLEAAGSTCHRATPDKLEIPAAAPERVLWVADGETDRELFGTDAMLALSHALDRAAGAARLRFDLVTRAAQPVGNETVDPQPGALVGLFRVILSEHPHWSCRAIDLPAAADESDAARVLAELATDATEREVAFRGAARYVQRIDRGLPQPERELPATTPLRLESRERGTLDAVRLTPFAEIPPGPGEVLIEVRAAGMNFRDVLKALGLYPAESPDARMFGDEVAGIVRAVGENVTHVAPGDPVFGLAAFGLATQALARGGDVRRLPEGLSFEEAATIPVVFMTAWHAIQNIARVRAGEWILIQAGAGGVGMAAIQIAQHLGLEVIATAGSPGKRNLLRTLGVKHILDSRRGDFAEAVMEITDGRGVDLVLNSLAGEAIPMGMSCLAEFGRFLEIGKRDIYQNSRIPLWPLRKNASFHVVAMDAVFNGDEALTRNLLAEIADLVERRALRPLPFRAFPAGRVDGAFRLMAAGRHIGKIVVTFAEPFFVRRGRLPRPAFAVQPDAAYLITGGLGGFGRVLARWLVECGARHLWLASRSGASTPEAEAFVADLTAQGVTVNVAKADLSSAADVGALIARISAAGAPLRGVFHLAMVIDDAPLAALNAERMHTVLAPKARGAWLLHEATRSLPLDQFVLFSSVSSVFGNPAQGNYAAANAYLDALAHHRQALGLPALAVNWGVLGGEGYVARNERVAEFLARQGTAALTPAEVISLLELFLNDGVAQAAAIRVDWAKWKQSFRGMQENPLVSRIMAATADEEGGAKEDWKARLAAAAPAEREEIIGQCVRTIIGGVLRVKPDSLRDDQPLSDLGLDSLMGAEIETTLDAALGVGLPPASLLRARTIGQIKVLIAEHMGAPVASKAAAPAAAPNPAVAADEIDLEALSDADIDALIADVPGSDEPDANEPERTSV